jgi:hypothetical protein
MTTSVPSNMNGPSSNVPPPSSGPVTTGPKSLTGAAIGAAQDITTSTTASNEAYMNLLDQSTAQTLQIQTALLNHNLTVGPVMAAKSASEDAKKT